MIDYSVYMLPNPVKPEAGKKAYAKAQMRELITFSKFVNHIADHNGVFTRGTVRGVIIDMCECLVEMLLDGKKVQLGELGDFWVSLSSEGAESLEKFSADNIKEVNIIFTPGSDFENIIGRAEFNIVASRAAQTATLKAEKAGATTVDLAAAKAAAKSGDSTSTSGNSGNSGSSSDDGGTRSSTGTDSGNTGSGTGSDSGSGSGSDSGSGLEGE